ncbi:ABC transporter ATP-binding protein [Halorubrum lipolyticum]|uniref:Molybdate/tungstate import ATP-binding protein WtpC n=1 Tax=Halorubrum lipolyticum DSM 21995 TaxID=1227482 RepID=M0NZ99_9EURY|nr:ABC transporter ATP-binding protein [Halorubrum lipolyticum]EMA62893.1 ABC transporter [Halorubrum lipolyticum DSM 21995]
MPDDAQLTVRNLRKRFGDEFAITDVDLTVGVDESVALLGPSGCGKTTILRCIAGVETPDEGAITIDGETVQGPNVSRSPEDRDVGMVYQNYAIWPHKTVYENVVFPLKHGDHDLSRAEYEPRVDSVLEMVEIANLKNNPATDLSGGQQQRVALARSLVHDPPLLLLDEPLSNLDKGLRRNMRYELQRLQHEIGFSMLYVTHNQQEAFYLADRVIVVRDGRVVESGSSRELYRRPTTAFTRDFVGQRNRFNGVIETDTDGQILVRTDLGRIPYDNVGYVATEAKTGSVVCFLRPGDISIGKFASNEADTLQFEGIVVAEGLLDDRYEIRVQLSGTETELTLHTRINQSYEPGDSLYGYVPPRAIQVYEDPAE